MPIESLKNWAIGGAIGLVIGDAIGGAIGGFVTVRALRQVITSLGRGGG